MAPKKGKNHVKAMWTHPYLLQACCVAVTFRMGTHLGRGNHGQLLSALLAFIRVAQQSDTPGLRFNFKRLIYC